MLNLKRPFTVSLDEFDSVTDLYTILVNTFSRVDDSNDDRALIALTAWMMWIQSGKEHPSEDEALDTLECIILGMRLFNYRKMVHYLENSGRRPSFKTVTANDILRLRALDQLEDLICSGKDIFPSTLYAIINPMFEDQMVRGFEMNSVVVPFCL